MSPVQVKKLHTFTGHRDCVYTLERSPEPSVFFSASGDGMVVQWDLNKPDEGIVVAKVPNSVYALHYHAGSGLLVAGQNYEGIHLLDWKNKKEHSSLKLTDAAIFDIRTAGDHLLVACANGELIKVHLPTLSITGRSNASVKSARSIAVNAFNGDIAVAYSDCTIRIFNEDLTLKQTWDAHGNSVFALRYTPDHQYLISGSRDARLKIWDVRSGYTKAAEIVAHMYAINHVEFSPDGKHFVTCSMDKSIKVWSLENLQLLKVIDRSRHAGHGTSVNRLLWTSFHDQLVSASDDRTISVWHIIF